MDEDKIVIGEDMFDQTTTFFQYSYFLERLGEEIAQVERNKMSLSLLMVSIDRFQQIGEQYGPERSDQVIAKAASVLNKYIRPVDIPVRYAFDKLGVALVNMNKKDAQTVAERIRAAVATQSFPGLATGAYAGGGTVTVSVGLVSYPEDGNTLQDLLDRAVQAAAQAQSLDGNSVVPWHGLEARTRFR